MLSPGAPGLGAFPCQINPTRRLHPEADQGVLWNVTCTSQALHPNITTSKARCGDERSELFLGCRHAEVDVAVRLIRLEGIHRDDPSFCASRFR